MRYKQRGRQPRGKYSLKDAKMLKARQSISIYNNDLMQRVIPQLIVGDLFTRLNIRAPYISEQHLYYIRTAKANLGSNEPEIEHLKSVDENELDGVVMVVYRLISFIAYKVINKEINVLAKIFLAIQVNNDELVKRCNGLVNSADEVIKIDDFDEDGKVIKSNECIYIELITALALFTLNPTNLLKTSGYEVNPIVFFLAGFNMPFLYSISAVLDTYFVKPKETLEALDAVLESNREKCTELTELYKNSPIFA